MTNNSHFGLFVGGFALMSLVSVYGSEFMPPLLASAAHAGEIAVPGTVEPVRTDGMYSSYENPRQLALPPGMPPMIAENREILRPILAKAEVPVSEDLAQPEIVGEVEAPAASILPNAASCPAVNAATRFQPAPAMIADSPAGRLSGPAPIIGLGTGTPCPAATRHTSVLAGVSPLVVPPGPSAPATLPNAAPVTP